MVENNTIYHLILTQSRKSVQNIPAPGNILPLTLDSTVIVPAQFT